MATSIPAPAEVVSVKRSDKPDTTEQSIFTDGGSIPAEQPQSPFETVSDTELSRQDRYRQAFHEYVVTPFRVIWADWRAQFGLAIILFYVLMGTVGVYLLDPPRASEGPLLLGAFQSWAFPLGTDGLGRGILGQIVYATPAMLKMITAGALFATGMATVWGVFAGYKGGSVDRLIMSFVDVLMTIPGLPLVVVLAAIIEPRNPYLVGIVLTINGWAGFARQLRAEVLKLRQNSYVEASRTMGISTFNIIAKDILPNVMPLIVVSFVTRARNVIIASVGLYFLGILPSSTLNWGLMLNSAYSNGGIYSPEQAHWLYAPMITIVLLSLGLLLFGQGCDRIFNPRIRARHAKPSGKESSDDTSFEEETI